MSLVKLNGVAISGLMLVLVACAGGADDVSTEQTGPAVAEVDSGIATASDVAVDTAPSAMQAPEPAGSRPAAKAPVAEPTTTPPPRPATQAVTPPPAKGVPVATVPTPTPVPPTQPAAQPPAQSAGLYTTAQASRGEEVYAMVCSQCHMQAQHSGPVFATTWNGRRVFDLYDLIANSMPMNDPGSLSTQEYVDVVAYILKLNAVPAGSSALRADEASLKQKRIEIRGPARQ